MALDADTKRLKGQELMKDSYVTHQATSFAGRQAEQRLEEAQRVRLFLSMQSADCPFSRQQTDSPPAGFPRVSRSDNIWP